MKLTLADRQYARLHGMVVFKVRTGRAHDENLLVVRRCPGYPHNSNHDCHGVHGWYVIPVIEQYSTVERAVQFLAQQDGWTDFIVRDEGWALRKALEVLG